LALDLVEALPTRGAGFSLAVVIGRVPETVSER